MVQAANVWLATLAPEQKARVLKPWEDAGRVGWHFIPKFERKGLPLREMVPSQQQGAFDLLRAAVSQAGYDKSRSIMQLDEMLRLQEGSNAKNIRDADRYFFTIFGTPAEKGTWGLSVEGHHLSLNFVVRDGQVVDSTPQFFGANPAEVRARRRRRGSSPPSAPRTSVPPARHSRRRSRPRGSPPPSSSPNSRPSFAGSSRRTAARWPTRFPRNA
jgi:hypothetical protein